MKRLLSAFNVEKISPARRGNMRNSLLPLICLSLCCVATSARAQVSFKEKPNKIEVESEGMVQIGRWAGKSGFKVFDRKGQEVLFDNTNEPDTHARNFIDCIRSRQTPNAEIELGHISTTYAHLANIVARTGRQLKFDPKTETILGDAEANRCVKRQYRKHWATPRDGARIT
jgi:hypothetical protein